MKKFYVIISMLCLALTMNAQTLLDEDFETESTELIGTPVAKGTGWTTVNSYSGTKTSYNWCNYYSEKGNISGKHSAYCDGPTYEGQDGGGFGPREEILLTPELDLNDTYQLSFDWIVSPMNAYERSLYDLQIRIVTGDDLANAETIFSIQNKEDLKESGVTTFPITSWDVNTSKLDLSDWKGQKVKIAFVYKMLTTIANCVWLDNVSVKQFTPDTTPVATIDNDRYNFGNVYVGEKFYTTEYTLKNTGLAGLKVSSVEMPSCVSINKDLTQINLDRLESVKFQLSYTASLFSPAECNVVLHTNGGDITIALSATKQVVPEGYTLESFEKYFPPAGWTNDGWKGVATALEGDCSAYATGSYTDQYLTSPRLDLTNGGHVIFSYYNNFTSEDGSTYQNNDISLELSTDGGQTWTQKWLFNYEDGDKQETKDIDLGTGTNNSYVRWHNTAVNTDDDGAYEFSDFYLDRILLPTLYGADGVPGAATLESPEDSVTEVYPRNIVLKWGPAQFATGYRLYVGSNDAANNLIDGLDLGNALTYSISKADYETMYNWKVVPYNNMGNADSVPVWHFTTQADASTSEYPYKEDFTANKLPAGWLIDTNATYANRAWSTNNIYGNSAPCLYTGWMYKGEYASVTTQEFTLPEGKNMSISFDWGNDHPSDLKTDATGLLKKQNMDPDNGASKVSFFIGVNDQWTELSYISENTSEEEYWRNEKINLSAYAGQTVQFRWTNYALSGKHDGASLDNIILEEDKADKAEFNKSEWAAGKVNYDKAVNSGEQFTMLNKGTATLKVASVKFTNSNFESSIKEGDEIQPNDGETFSLQFNAGTTAKIYEDNMVVTFEDGYSVSFPVSGEALAKDVYYYSFEDNALDYEWNTDFTLIDADGAVSFQPSGHYLTWSKFGTRMAFDVADDSEMNYVMSPISGTRALVGPSPADACADNWIISKQLDATENSTFDFYGRNWESLESVLPSAQFNITVLVSTTGNTSTENFTDVVLKSEDMPYLSRHAYNHYTVDLSKYAGQKIYVALRETTNEASNLSFFDDFTFSHFGEASEEKTLDADVNNDGGIDVSDVNSVISVICGNGTNSKADVNGDGRVDISDVNAVIGVICARK